MKTLLIGVTLALAAGPLPGQEAEPPAFPTLAEVVVLDMVVRDADGQPVTDLRADEVEILEDGMPCLIQSFRLVRPGSPGAAEPARAAPQGPVPAPAAEGVAPRDGAGTDDPAGPLRPNVVILVFDRMGMESAGTARQAATDFARREFPPETWFAVYEIGDRVRARQRITRDPAELLAAIEQSTARADQARAAGTTPDHATITKEALSAALKASMDPTGAQGVDPAAAGWIRSGGEPHLDQAQARLLRLADTMERQRLGSSALNALLDVARELAGLKGRKTMLLFSEGLHVPSSLTDVLETLVSEANRSNLAIYAIDPRGLLAERSFEEAKMALLAARNVSEQRQRTKDPQTSAAQDPIQSPEQDQSASPTEVQMHDIAEDALRMNTQANLQDLAEETGGFLVANTNDLSSGLERIGSDLRSYYEVAYQPFNPIADGRFRTIEAKVSRPNTRVRTRRGYFARPPEDEPTLAPYELALAQAFDLPTPPRDFGHRVTAEVVGGDPDRAEVHVALQVPLRALQFDYDRADRTYRAHFSVLVVVRERDGKVVNRLSHDWPIAGPLMDAPNVRNQSATVKRALVLAPGEYTLDSVVADRLGGGLSMERTPLRVPPPGVPGGDRETP